MHPILQSLALLSWTFWLSFAAASAALFYAIWLLIFAYEKLPTGPSPPVISSVIPFVGCGLRFIKNPRSFLDQTRQQVGDTFILHMFGLRLLFVFSPAGLRSLYKVREKDASFAEATRGLLGLKVPNEALDGSMDKFHRGLRRNLLQTYIGHVNTSVNDALAKLTAQAAAAGAGGQGQFEIFSHMKHVVHRVGFLSWVGPEAASERYMQRLIDAFEALDPETGFQNLSSVAVTLLTRKYREKKALDDMELVLREIWEHRLQQKQQTGESSVPSEDNLTSLHELYADLPLQERYRKVAVDVFQFHLASQANMYAALSWTFINLLLQDRDAASGTTTHARRLLEECAALRTQFGKEYCASIEALDSGLRYAEGVFQESLRLAQQSITLRKALKPTVLEDERSSYTVPKGYYLATLLSVTNVDSTKDAASSTSEFSLRKFNPSRYLGNKLDLSRPPFQVTSPVPSEPHPLTYTVSTFGHGFHACPGMGFAVYVCKVVLARYFSRLEMRPLFDSAEVPPTSVGAIARCTHPCEVQYKVRTNFV